MARRSEWDDWLPPGDTATLRAEPMYGQASFTPQTRCCDVHPHGIPRGSVCYCEVCSAWGRDGFESAQQHPDWDISARMRKAEKEAKAKKGPAKFKARIKSKKAARLASPGRTQIA